MCDAVDRILFHSKLMKKIILVFGTRPEAVKMCPLILELKKRKSMEVLVCLSGQHTDMTHSVLNEFGVDADIDLCIMKKGQTLFDITETVLKRVGAVIKKISPDVVLVHGDTTTAFATALSAYYSNIPVGHIEAGLRSGNIYEPFPEEFNRKAISLIAKYNFAPTLNAIQMLKTEGIKEESLFLVGNTVVDAVKYSMNTRFTSPLIDLASNKACMFLTAHRRENLGMTMREMLMGVREAVDDIRDLYVIYPVHPNPLVRSVAHEVLGGHSRIIMTEPLGVRETHNLIAKSRFIVTDSGGIQEEAVSLGKRVLVMRRVTERPEGIEAGFIKLIGTDREAVRLEINKAYLAHEGSSQRKSLNQKNNPFGDGNASKKIADVLEQMIV